MELKHILIINQPLGNRGDESAHRALVRAINRSLPDVEVTVLAFQVSQEALDEFRVKNERNHYVDFLFPHNMAATQVAIYLVQHGLTGVGTWLHPILRRIVKYYDEADVVLCAPGGICMGGFQNWRHMYLLQLARLRHKPLAYYSRSIGPFPTATKLNRRFKTLAMQMLGSFDFLSLRDRKSKDLANELGLTYVPSVDTAFLDYPQADVPNDVKSQLSEHYVVFVPNELTWHFAYRHVPQAKVDELNLQILKELSQAYPNYQVVMLPQLCSLKKKDDYSYFLKLKKAASLENVLVLPDTTSSDLQQVIIRKAAMVVGARYHSVVFSINNEVPFVALGYEHKIPGLLEDLGLAERMVDITSAFDSDESLTRTLTLFKEVLDQQKGQAPKRQQAATIAEDCFSQLLDRLNQLER